MDLQPFVDENNSIDLEIEYEDRENKEFITYIAPRKKTSNLEELVVPTPAITVFLENKLEYIPNDIFRMLGCKGKFDEN